MTSTRRQFLNATAGLSLTAACGPLFAQTAAKGKKLIVYFSWSGNTRYIANLIAEKTGADLVELELLKPYSSNYSQCLDEAKRDQRADARPALQTKIVTTSPNMTQFLSAIPIGGHRFRCRLPHSWKAMISLGKPSRRFAAMAAAGSVKV